MKTPEEMAQEYVIGRFPDTNSDTFLAAESVHKAFIAGYKAAQTNLPTPAKWISVKERLPDKSPMVLAMCIDGYELAYYGMYGQGWTNTLGTEHLNVTHWMPLPEAPKEQK